MCEFIVRDKDKPKHLSEGFCLFDSEAEQKALRFSHSLGLNETLTAQLLNQIKEICLANL